MQPTASSVHVDGPLKKMSIKTKLSELPDAKSRNAFRRMYHEYLGIRGHNAESALDSASADFAELTTRGRKRLDDSDFALPHRRYPIHDAAHARNALARVAQNGTPEEVAKVKAAVHKKFPDMGKDAKKNAEPAPAVTEVKIPEPSKAKFGEGDKVKVIDSRSKRFGDCGHVVKAEEEPRMCVACDSNQFHYEVKFKHDGDRETGIPECFLQAEADHAEPNDTVKLGGPGSGRHKETEDSDETEEGGKFRTIEEHDKEGDAKERSQMLAGARAVKRGDKFHVQVRMAPGVK